MRRLAGLFLLLVLTACAPAPSGDGAAVPRSPVSPVVTPAGLTAPTAPAGLRPVTSPPPTAPAPFTEPATVRTVIDGDTLTVVTLRGEAVVRLIGIDAPERGSDGHPPECYNEEATRLLAELAPPGTVVLLERDVSETDRYGRLLRYVWIDRNGQRLLLNEELVRRGAAVAREYPPDTRYAARLAAAQQVAQATRAGLWSHCSTADVTPTSTAPPARDARCDPSYPDICVPPPPPDLDCRDIPYRRFRVQPPDPHRLDTDRDGIGCESG
ncbi:thermonuclease family protein [Thermomicrobium sp. 4228-Ro]|uniref:thermonuclease family protein n=1 Tax=Thermomicrobium sp. 4228-Ro TaxID=2993937 RepID=UPI0022489145|nr:thermonuclease family protein [Thermomicrobium sp. 4228-Ro]MCX2727828.1 thermonuclease family protein [Thermomicrobium sp. 4228-Ro]